MFKAYVIVLVLHAGFVFQGCAGLEYLDGSSRKERTKFKMTKEEMWNEMERLRIGNSKLERQIGTLEKESQRISDENENKMIMMRDQNVLLNEQMEGLRQANQRIKDENQVLEKKLTKLQLKDKTLSAKSYKLKKPDYKTKSMYVQERSVRVRSGPGINYRAIGGRRLGDKILTKDVKGNWYRIVDPKDFDKITGWIHGSLLDEMPPGQ